MGIEFFSFGNLCAFALQMLKAMCQDLQDRKNYKNCNNKNSVKSNSRPQYESDWLNGFFAKTFRCTEICGLKCVELSHVELSDQMTKPLWHRTYPNWYTQLSV